MKEGINYWRMFMHPTGESEYDNYIEWILSERRFIGLGNEENYTSDRSGSIQKFRQMMPNDIVVVRKNKDRFQNKRTNGIVALVQIKSDVDEESAKSDKDERTNWMDLRREIEVLDWYLYDCEIDLNCLATPDTRATVLQLSEENETIKELHFARKWLSEIMTLKKNIEGNK